MLATPQSDQLADPPMNPKTSLPSTTRARYVVRAWSGLLIAPMVSSLSSHSDMPAGVGPFPTFTSDWEM